MTALPDKLKKLRKDKGLTQEELSKSLGISKKTYVNWEQGRNPLSIKNFEAIASFYRLPISYFLDDNAEAKESDHLLSGFNSDDLDKMDPEEKKLVRELIRYIIGRKQ